MIFHIQTLIFHFLRMYVQKLGHGNHFTAFKLFDLNFDLHENSVVCLVCNDVGSSKGKKELKCRRLFSETNWDHHKLTSVKHKIALDRMELAGAFYFTIPGPKMIWQFGELGYDISINQNDRTGNKPIKWEYFDEKKKCH